jgi:hypothetical protein
MNCNFCDKTLNSIITLRYHQKNAKKCLEIQKNQEQNIMSALVSCEYCNKEFSKSSLKSHFISCKKKLKVDKEKEIDNLKFELENLKKYSSEEIENLKFENNNLKNIISKLEAENKIYLQDHNFVKTMAAQPKITTTNNTNKIKINNNFFDNPEKIKQMIEQKLNKEYISDGQKGVAQFAYDTLLKDEEGNMNYICSDPSRHIFKFQNSEGNIEKDIKANKLTNMLIDAGITNKTFLIAPSLWTKDDGNIDSNKFQIYVPYTTEISSMQVDNTIFRNELACLTSL